MYLILSTFLWLCNLFSIRQVLTKFRNLSSNRQIRYTTLREVEEKRIISISVENHGYRRIIGTVLQILKHVPYIGEHALFYIYYTPPSKCKQNHHIN